MPKFYVKENMQSFNIKSVVEFSNLFNSALMIACECSVIESIHLQA